MNAEERKKAVMAIMRETDGKPEERERRLQELVRESDRDRLLGIKKE
jgi:hypothetical protein